MKWNRKVKDIGMAILMYAEEITCPLAVDVDDDDDDIPSIVLSSFLHKMDKYCNILGY